jgi:Sulfatase
VDPVLDQGTALLSSAGFASRSGWLTSPTFGGGSWLAHSTFESGLWINNEQRYRNLVSSERLTMTRAFRDAGWRTVSVMPGATRAWPEGQFYGYDQVWDSRTLGYQGPKFSWAPMPDQYTLKQLNTIEYGKANRRPLMIEMPLVSSHTPWAPIPSYLPDWNQVGDGSIYQSMVANGQKPKALWAEPKNVRPEYGKSIRYSVTSLVNWIRLYGDDNLVMVFLGDHQPSPIAAGANASHDVPISIVAKDPAVLDRIAGWGWADGLRPASATPVWPMSQFRDRFFAAFGPGTPAS